MTTLITSRWISISVCIGTKYGCVGVFYTLAIVTKNMVLLLIFYVFVCDFWKDDVYKQELHSEIEKFLTSKDLKNPLQTLLKTFSHNFMYNWTSDNLFPSLTCLLHMYFTLHCTAHDTEHTMSALHYNKNYFPSTTIHHKFNSCCFKLNIRLSHREQQT